MLVIAEIPQRDEVETKRELSNTLLVSTRDKSKKISTELKFGL